MKVRHFKLWGFAELWGFVEGSSESESESEPSDSESDGETVKASFFKLTRVKSEPSDSDDETRFKGMLESLTVAGSNIIRVRDGNDEFRSNGKVNLFFDNYRDHFKYVQAEGKPYCTSVISFFVSGAPNCETELVGALTPRETHMYKLYCRDYYSGGLNCLALQRMLALVEDQRCCSRIGEILIDWDGTFSVFERITGVQNDDLHAYSTCLLGGKRRVELLRHIVSNVHRRGIKLHILSANRAADKGGFAMRKILAAAFSTSLHNLDKEFGLTEANFTFSTKGVDKLTFLGLNGTCNLKQRTHPKTKKAAPRRRRRWRS
jgi:hypothetical protein